MLSNKIQGVFGYGPATAAGGTAFIQGVPPFPGVQAAAPLLYAAKPGNATLQNANWWGSGNTGLIARILQLIYTTGATAHKVGVMEPLNFAYITTAVAKATATFVLDKDPGVYSTNYRYHTPGGVAPSNVADNAIAAGDYVAYQLADGTWVFDTVASGTFGALVLTTNVPSPTGAGGVLAGTPMFDFGIIGDKRPSNGMVPYQITVPASGTQTTYKGDTVGIWGAAHPGDPLIFYSPNTTNAGTLDLLAAYFANNP